MKRLNLKRRVKKITDYKKRLALLKSGKTRLVVRKSNKNLVAQLVDYVPSGDKVLMTSDLSSLKKLGWKGGINTPSAYLIGFELGTMAKKAKVNEAILDTGRHPKSSRMFAVVKGVIDAGLKVPVGEKALPSEERIKGNHVNDYMKVAKGHQFASYKKEKVEVTKDFETVLKKLQGEK